MLTLIEEISDKMEIFYLKRDDGPIELYASIKRWKWGKESTIEVTLNEKIFTRLVRSEPFKKKEANDAFIAEGIKDKSYFTPQRIGNRRKIAEREKMVKEGIDKVYTNMLL